MFNLYLIVMKNLKYLLLFAIVFACQPNDGPNPVVENESVKVAAKMEVEGIDVDLGIEAESNARWNWRSRCKVPKPPTTSNCDDPDVITFDDQGLSDGDFVSKVEMGAGTVTIFVEGINVRFPEQNAAMIFDSNTPNPDGDDLDLGTPNEMYGGPGVGDGGESNKFTLNNLLILSEDLDPTDPDDDNWSNGKIYFDFSDIDGGATLISIDVIDIDENQALKEPYVLMLDADGNEIKKLLMPATGNNGYARLDLEKTVGVYTMVIRLAGSGAIDNLTYCYASAQDCGCTKTQGWWKNHHKGWNKLRHGENTKFFKSEISWKKMLKTAPKHGNAYVILAHQYIAAVLNMKNGACAPDEVKHEILKATLFYMWYTPTQCKKMSKRTRTKLIKNADILAKYNEGDIGPGHCN